MKDAKGPTLEDALQYERLLPEYLDTAKLLIDKGKQTLDMQPPSEVENRELLDACWGHSLLTEGLAHLIEEGYNSEQILDVVSQLIRSYHSLPDSSQE